MMFFVLLSACAIFAQTLFEKNEDRLTN